MRQGARRGWWRDDAERGVTPSFTSGQKYCAVIRLFYDFFWRGSLIAVPARWSVSLPATPQAAGQEGADFCCGGYAVVRICRNVQGDLWSAMLVVRMGLA